MNDASASQPLVGIDHVREQFHNLHEFVAVARAKLDRNVWDYLIGGAETETTVRRNRMALDSLAFRPRVLRDVSKIDSTAAFLGTRTRLPVMLAPIGACSSSTSAATRRGSTTGCAAPRTTAFAPSASRSTSPPTAAASATSS